MNRQIVKVFLVGAMALCMVSTAAAKKEEAQAIAAVNKTAFAEQAAAVRQQMDKGGHFEMVTGEERRRVDARLDEMAAIFEQGDVATLSKAKIADLLVAQEDINAILTRRDGRRMICERVKIVGSHMKSMQCITYAEQERGRRVSQDAMRSNARSSYSDKPYGDGR